MSEAPSKWVPLEASPDVSLILASKLPSSFKRLRSAVKQVFNAVSHDYYCPVIEDRITFIDTLHIQWSEPLGLPQSLAFQDLFSLDPSFLSFVPAPHRAVLLLFPSKGKLKDERRKEDQDDGNQFNGEGIWWIKQTVEYLFQLLPDD